MVLAVAATVIGYLAMTGANGLSDAESVWCEDHADVVGRHADQLGLAPPETADSWTEWGELVMFGGLSGGWNALTIEADRPNRDRACRSAFQSRS